MGAGASTEAKDALEKCSEEELSKQLKELPLDCLAKLKAAVTPEKPKDEGVWTPWIDESVLVKIKYVSFFYNVKSDVAYVSQPELFRKMHFGDAVTRLALKPGDGKEVFIQACDLPTLEYKPEEREFCFMSSQTGAMESHKCTGEGDAGKLQGMFKYRKADSWTPWLDLNELTKTKFVPCDCNPAMSCVTEPEESKNKFECYEITRMALKPGDGKEIFIEGKDLPSLTYECNDSGCATAICYNGTKTELNPPVLLKGMYKHLRTDWEDKPKDEGEWTPWIEEEELASIKYVSFFSERLSDLAYVSAPDSYKTDHFGNAVTRLALKPGDGKEVFIPACDLPTLEYKLSERKFCFVNSKTNQMESHEVTGEGDAGKLKGMFKYKKADTWTPWLDMSMLKQLKFASCSDPNASAVTEPEECKKKYSGYQITRLALKPGYGKEIFIEGKDLPSLTYQCDEHGCATAICFNGTTTQIEPGAKLMGMFKHMRQ
eukprot:TRINITY_DN45170_c0_g1_i1.p1 TRINITY_DN45170_c0_g1~~TRINITY_DN45170_c0_g1_i1.p1  ORF type:complete len:487 (+),score=105.98 TRINITY_DN45170_c0_g1_i1:66-1526(+)